MNCLTLKSVIVDDEASARQNLKLLLIRYCPSIHVIDMASSADSASSIINQIKPDVLFLDIAMPQKSGFELLNMLSFLPSIVFVTAHERFALRALKACAVDFLLKPVDVNELIAVEKKLHHIHTAMQEIKMKEDYKQVVQNLVHMFRSQEAVKKVTLHHSTGLDIIDVDNIVFLEGENNYTTFNIQSQRKITVSKTLKEYEEILTESGFMRIHKSSMINLRHLKNMSVRNGVEAIMSDESVLPVSRRRATEFVDKAKQYLG